MSESNCSATGDAHEDVFAEVLADVYADGGHLDRVCAMFLHDLCSGDSIDNNIDNNMMPDNMMPDNMMPDNMMPDNMMPDNMMPDNMMPDNMMPDNMMPDNMMPDNMMPDNMMPDNMMPDNMMPGNMMPGVAAQTSVSDLNSFTDDVLGGMFDTMFSEPALVSLFRDELGQEGPVVETTPVSKKRARRICGTPSKTARLFCEQKLGHLGLCLEIP